MHETKTRFDRTEKTNPHSQMYYLSQETERAVMEKSV